MTDVGRAEMRLPLCNDVFQAEMAAADRRLRGRVREGRPGFAGSRPFGFANGAENSA